MLALWRAQPDTCMVFVSAAVASPSSGPATRLSAPARTHTRAGIVVFIDMRISSGFVVVDGLERLARPDRYANRVRSAERTHVQRAAEVIDGRSVRNGRGHRPAGQLELSRAPRIERVDVALVQAERSTDRRRNPEGREAI